MKYLILFIFSFGSGYFIGSQKNEPIILKKPIERKFSNGNQSRKKVNLEIQRNIASENAKSSWFYLKESDDSEFNAIDNARCKVSRFMIRGKKNVEINLFCQGSALNQEILRQKIISQFKI